MQDDLTEVLGVQPRTFDVEMDVRINGAEVTAKYACTGIHKAGALIAAGRRLEGVWPEAVLVEVKITARTKAEVIDI
tara:strand:- start:7398 stop:7628 length:231 start_codon:yes stop_codon:yes gene_type:complete